MSEPEITAERSQTPLASNTNAPDWCSERYGFVTVPKDGSRDFRKLSDGPWCSWVEAQTKIEQLTRERDAARATVQLTETITARMERLARGRVEEDRDRLRAALERFMTHPEVHLCECGEPGCATRQAREALSGAGLAPETSASHLRDICDRIRSTLRHRDDGVNVEVIDEACSEVFWSALANLYHTGSL